MVKIEDYRNDLDIKDLEILEEEIELTFPSDYRKFLVDFNGGYPDPDGFEFVDMDGQKSGSSVDRFLELGDGEYNNFKKYIDLYRG